MATSSSVSDILTHCRHSQHRLFFQSLGMSIGIKPWTGDFGGMLEEEVSDHCLAQQQGIKQVRHILKKPRNLHWANILVLNMRIWKSNMHIEFA